MSVDGLQFVVYKGISTAFSLKHDGGGVETRLSWLERDKAEE